MVTFLVVTLVNKLMFAIALGLAALLLLLLLALALLLLAPLLLLLEEPGARGLRHLDGELGVGELGVGAHAGAQLRSLLRDEVVEA